MLVNYKKINKDAIEPTYGSEYAAGLDLYSAEDNYIDPGETIKIHTGISIEIPNGFFGAIYARSGLAAKQGLRPANCVGIIDADYRGELIVAMHNDSVMLREIHKGDRIAQIVIQPMETVVLNEVHELTDTKRGSGRFGSTGVGKNEHKECIFDYEEITLNDTINSMTGMFGDINV